VTTRQRRRPGRRFRLPAVATILGGTLVGQGLVIVVSPLLTRLYDPRDFGALAVVTAIASVIGAGATAGTDRAVVVAADDRTVRALAWIGTVSVALVGVVAGVAASSLRDPVAERFGTPVLSSSWWIVPVTIVAVGAQRIVSAILARDERHRALGLRNAVQGVGQTAWNVLGAWAGPLGLVGGLAVGRALAVLGVGVLRPRRSSFDAVLQAGRRHRRFLLVSPWSAVANVLGQQAPSLLLAALHGATAAGLVALTMRVLGAPVGMLADAVAQYAAGAFGRLVRGGRPVQPLVVRLVGRLAVAGAVGVVVVVAAAPAAFRAVFGSEWAVSGEYARIMVPAFAVQVAVSPLTQLLAMVGRQTAQLLWDVGRLVLTAAAVAVPSVIGAPMSIVLASLAGAMIAAYGTMLALVIGAGQQEVADVPRVRHVENSDRRRFRL